MMLSVLQAIWQADASFPSGSFGFMASAYQMDSGGENGLALVGIMNFDGAGNVSGPAIGKHRSTNPGEPAVPTSFTGTYKSNPDGTGSITAGTGAGSALAKQGTVPPAEPAWGPVSVSRSCRRLPKIVCRARATLTAVSNTVESICLWWAVSFSL